MMARVIAWMLAVVIGMMGGVVVGHGSGAHAERKAIANECKQAGAFTVKRTAFRCEVIKK
jgi:hypothetical protein